jgi:phosphate transport system permease protein
MNSVQLHEYMSRTHQRRKWVDRWMSGLLLLAAFAALVPLFSVLGYVVWNGAGYLNWDFFSKLPKPVGETGGGMANALAGTCTLVATASLIGVPWGVAAGVFLSEYGDGKLGTIVRFATDMLASVPSIVIGLFVYALIVVPMGGFSAMAGGVALAIIMIPIVARSTEEIVRLVPVHIREAGLALGLSRWKVILRIVLRGCVSGITTGVMLAVARVAGETAPLLLTSLNNQYWNLGLTGPIASLPVQIYSYAISPFDEWHGFAWAGALLLVLMVFVVNVLARLVFGTGGSGRD